MAKRMKQLAAFMIICLLLLQLPGVEVLAKEAMQIFTSDGDVTIDSDYDGGCVIYGSGGAATVTLADGCTLNGDVDISGTNNDSACHLVLGNGSVIKGSIIDSASAGATVTLNNSIVKGIVNLSGTTMSGSGKIGTLHLNGGSASFHGNTEIGTLTMDSGTLSLTSGTLTITDSLAIHSAGLASPLFTIQKDTAILTNSAITVSYNGAQYPIAADSNGTVYDILGNTIEVANTKDSHITNPSGNAAGAKYMKGDTVTFSYEAEDGYYFPENYLSDSAAFTVDNGYTASLNVTRKNYSEIEVQYSISDETAKNIKIHLPAATVRPEGTGTVTVADIHYGGTLKPVIASTTNDVDSATVQYKKQGAPDTEYSNEVPTAIGDYTVRVSFQEKDYYKGFEATDDFSIQYLKAPATPYTISGTKGKNEFYTSDVKIIPPEEFSIADILDGEYNSYLMYDTTVSDKKIYLKKDLTGEKTDAITLEAFRIDQDAPAVNAVNGQIYYKDFIEITVQDNNLDTITVDDEPVKTNDTSQKLILASDNGVSVYNIAATDKAGNSTTVKVTVAAEWTKTGSIPNGSAVRLMAGQSYKFGSGTWKVGEDTTCYNGDTTFYVKTGGTYTFTQQSITQ